ncbi:hypothetical protein N7466_000117 [Penicillium verhagenii]|uniref:uncharacterized protein n=1 Tax=Penicillium verhagenii TaxID=1562060 RepID=UPI0025459C3C|nr:uncharacterized protein N7466_000117 [Penicillium verhagenii]KAJ5947102.1 hypothetical protein N7466_000117 [Penicillium verhagenii]
MLIALSTPVASYFFMDSTAPSGFEFDADVLSFFGRTGRETIASIADTFLADLANMRRADYQRERPLILFGHSLGGLIIKRAMSKAWDEDDPTSADVFRRRRLTATSTKAIIFAGTPHRGSARAETAAWATSWLGAFGVSTTPENIRDVQEGSNTTQMLREEFLVFRRKIRDSRARAIPPEPDITTYTFAEGRPMPVIGMIVTLSSATLDMQNEIVSSVAGCDHRTMVKFASRDAAGYKQYLGAIQNVIDEVQREQGAALQPHVSPLTSSSLNGSHFGTMPRRREIAGAGTWSQFNQRNNGQTHMREILSGSQMAHNRIDSIMSARQPISNNNNNQSYQPTPHIYPRHSSGQASLASELTSSISPGTVGTYNSHELPRDSEQHHTQDLSSATQMAPSHNRPDSTFAPPPQPAPNNNTHNHPPTLHTYPRKSLSEASQSTDSTHSISPVTTGSYHPHELPPARQNSESEDIEALISEAIKCRKGATRRSATKQALVLFSHALRRSEQSRNPEPRHKVHAYFGIADCYCDLIESPHVSDQQKPGHIQDSRDACRVAMQIAQDGGSHGQMRRVRIYQARLDAQEFMLRVRNPPALDVDVSRLQVDKEVIEHRLRTLLAEVESDPGRNDRLWDIVHRKIIQLAEIRFESE